MDSFEELIRRVIEARLLSPRFQPILELRGGAIHGFEGLIRGPSDTMLHSPLNLFQVASRFDLLPELESACIRTLVEAYAQSGQQSRLFLNVSPRALLQAYRDPWTRELRAFGLSPKQIVIELTESEPTFEWGPLLQAAEFFRAMGFAIALDDLGEGFASLKMWSELRPDYVKIDKYFVQGVSFDPVKHQFLRTISELASRMGAITVAEGIETEADLATLRDLGLDLVQGYLLGRPAQIPVACASHFLLGSHDGQKPQWMGRSRITAAKLLSPIQPIEVTASNQDVQLRFAEDSALQVLPVVQDGLPVGILNRNHFMEMLAKPYRRELFGKRSCADFMEKRILIVDQQTSLHELSQQLMETDLRISMEGFVITRNGAYAGMASGQALLREITEWQINAARYANPLTQLPGNVPIQEYLETLLEQEGSGIVAYADLDHFKPYNDVYGYRKGDEIIQWTGMLLASACDPSMDFLGHVGGDDFILVLRGPNWEEQLEGILQKFAEGASRFFSPADLRRGGYETEDRSGTPRFHPLVSLSIGAIKISDGQFSTHHEVSAALTAAKKMAKKTEGCSLFIERRTA